MTVIWRHLEYQNKRSIATVQNSMLKVDFVVPEVMVLVKDDTVIVSNYIF